MILMDIGIQFGSFSLRGSISTRLDSILCGVMFGQAAVVSGELSWQGLELSDLDLVERRREEKVMEVLAAWNLCPSRRSIGVLVVSSQDSMAFLDGD